jgi:hypothetical protein
VTLHHAAAAVAAAAAAVRSETHDISEKEKEVITSYMLPVLP